MPLNLNEDEDETRPRKGRILQPGETYRVPMIAMDELQTSIAQSGLGVVRASDGDVWLVKPHDKPSAAVTADESLQAAQDVINSARNALGGKPRAPIQQQHTADQQPPRKPEYAF